MDADFAAFVEAVRKMRELQKRYFAGERVLLEAKKAEDKVDRMLAKRFGETGQTTLTMEDETE